LTDLHAELQPLRQGQLACYIPELTKASPDWFGFHMFDLSLGRCRFTKDLG
jgi:glutaminase